MPMPCALVLSFSHSSQLFAQQFGHILYDFRCFKAYQPRRRPTVLSLRAYHLFVDIFWNVFIPRWIHIEYTRGCAEHSRVYLQELRNVHGKRQYWNIAGDQPGIVLEASESARDARWSTRISPSNPNPRTRRHR